MNKDVKNKTVQKYSVLIYSLSFVIILGIITFIIGLSYIKKNIENKSHNYDKKESTETNSNGNDFVNYVIKNQTCKVYGDDWSYDSDKKSCVNSVTKEIIDISD